MTITSFYYFLVYQKLKFSVHQWNSTCLAKGLIFYQWRHRQWDASLQWTRPRILPGLPRGRNQQSVCTSIIWAFQQECCSMHHPRRNSNICNCCSLRLIQRHHDQASFSLSNWFLSWYRCFCCNLVGFYRDSYFITKEDPFRQSAVWLFIPPVANAKALSKTQQIIIILMDPLWVNIVKDKLRKSL